MQKHVNLVDLVKRFPTNIFLQNLASIQKRTSPVKFAHLAEKSGKGSILNLSTKVYIAAASARVLASGNHPRHASGSGGRTSAYERRELQAAGGISSALVDLNSSELNSPRAARARDGLGDGDN